MSGVVGLSLAVVDHGETIFQENMGYRDLANEKPVTSDTIFPIASLTKSFTTACINRLRAQDKLAFDDLISTLLPEAKSQDSVVAATITVADILGHRTGLQKADSLWLGANGEVMFDKDQTASILSQLRPQTSIRSRFLYSNIAFAVLGQLITKITGQPYHLYLKEHILEPLGMTRTLVAKGYSLVDDCSLAYSTLENRDPYNVSLPAPSADGAMGAAGGLRSSVNDLIKFYMALMRSWQEASQARREDTAAVKEQPVFGDVAWLFAPLQIMETPALREKSYAGGWARSQLPTTVGDIGVNPGLVGDMPILAQGVNSCLALWHQGSLVGATSFVMLFPETESAVLVLTNTMALNDAADWIGQLLVETLLDSPYRNDFVKLASLSADRALKRYIELTNMIEEGRVKDGPSRSLSDYTGSYVGLEGLFRIMVVEKHGQLNILFQERQSQRYPLQHHHENTFTWFMSWDDQIRRSRFINAQPAFYFIHFEENSGKEITTLNWKFDVAMTEGEDFSKKR